MVSTIRAGYDHAKVCLQTVRCKQSVAKIPLQCYLCNMNEIDDQLANADGDATDDVSPVFNDRDLDLVSLKALAHPLRVQIVDTLSTYGCFTASGLAERLGESSGATSYHLRQLEKHGFVREVEGRGTSRERWWERVPGGLNIGSEEARSTPAGRSAATLIWRQFRYAQDQLLTDFVERAHEVLPESWLDGASVSTMNTRLTPQQMRAFVRDFNKLVDKYVIPNKNQTAPGSRPFHIDFNAFPVVDGDVVPDESGEEQ
jgi:DNA-binding transcriptional ArsR family regulator